MPSISTYILESRAAGFVADAQNILDLSTEDNCAFRSNAKEHFVAGAVVLNPARDAVLMIHHNFLQKTLFPGGHIDDHEDALVAAFREVFEETGYRARPLLAHPIDIDSHPIPENPGKGEAAHTHHDLLFLGEADDMVMGEMAEQEVSAVLWMPLDRLPEISDRCAWVKLKIERWKGR